MTITLELSTEQERLLREGATSADAAAMRRVLHQAIESTVEKLLRLGAKARPVADFEALADRLAKQFAATGGPDHRPLSDEAVTRAGIYGDHP